AGARSGCRRGADLCDRPSPQRHPARAGDRRCDREAGLRRHARSGHPAVRDRPFCARACGRMTGAIMPKTKGTVRINGRSEPLTVTSLAALLDAKADEIPSRGVAIAVNGSVVPRTSWPATPLNDGDRVEIVRVMQGG